MCDATVQMGEGKSGIQLDRRGVVRDRQLVASRVQVGVASIVGDERIARVQRDGRGVVCEGLGVLASPGVDVGPVGWAVARFSGAALPCLMKAVQPRSWRLRSRTWLQSSTGPACESEGLTAMRRVLRGSAWWGFRPRHRTKRYDGFPAQARHSAPAACRVFRHV